MRKIISLILALAMIMALAVSASAAVSFKVTLNNPEGSTVDTSDLKYTAIRLLDAEFSDAGGVTYYMNASEVKTYMVDSGFFNVTYSADGTKAYISLTEAGKAAEPGQIAYALGYQRFNLISTEFSYDSATGMATIEGLAPGYYQIRSSLGSKTLIATYDDGTYEVVEKVEYPTLTKTVNGGKTATVDNNGEVEFTITVSIPESAISDCTMFIYDETDGVTIDLDSIEVSDPNSSGYNTPLSVTYENGKLTLKLIEYFYKSNLGEDITITYTGTVDALEENATNKAYAALGYNPDDPAYVTKDDSVVISNASVSIYKYTGNNEPLEGAGFVLAKKDDEGNVSGYYTMSDGTVDWVTDIDDATEYKSGADGNVPAFEGLAEGTYYIVEKTVPAGYNKADDSSVTIETDSNGIAVDPALVSVVNNTGSELPSTGGMGTTLFYVIGGLMMTCAVVVLVTKRRVA